MAHEKPNVVFILSDDPGASALGCSGNQKIRMPNFIDLAKNGLLFENLFCTPPRGLRRRPNRL